MPKYIPGQEPADIKKKLDLYFPKIEAAYPDKQIRHMYKEHKKWLERAGVFRKMLGYDSNKEFFAAYGFTMADGNAEQKIDSNDVIEELKVRYKNNPFVGTLSELKDANPDIADRIQTFVNKSTKEFGLPARAFLISKGILDNKESRKNKQNDFAENPIEKLNEFVTKWKSEGCIQYKNVNVFFKECGYIEGKGTFSNWVKIAYGISAKEFLEILGALKVKIEYKTIKKGKRNI